MKFKKGDIVICTKFGIEQSLVIGERGFQIDNHIDDKYFNRQAMVVCTYKERVDEVLGIESEKHDLYKIKFLDDGSCLAWVSESELVLLTTMKFIKS